MAKRLAEVEAQLSAIAKGDLNLTVAVAIVPSITPPMTMPASSAFAVTVPAAMFAPVIVWAAICCPRA